MTLRIRRGMFEMRLPDIDAVRAGLSDGTITGDDEIWDPVEEQWVLASVVAGTGTTRVSDTRDQRATDTNNGAGDRQLGGPAVATRRTAMKIAMLSGTSAIVAVAVAAFLWSPGRDARIPHGTAGGEPAPDAEYRDIASLVAEPAGPAARDLPRPEAPTSAQTQTEVGTVGPAPTTPEAESEEPPPDAVPPQPPGYWADRPLPETGVDVGVETWNPSWGPEDAPVTIVAFVDYLSGLGRSLMDDLRIVRDAYGQRVRIVFRSHECRRSFGSASFDRGERAPSPATPGRRSTTRRGNPARTTHAREDVEPAFPGDCFQGGGSLHP